MSVELTQVDRMRTVLMSTIGSHMHMCASASSDIDLRIVSMTPLEHLISPLNYKNIRAKVAENDIVYYELRHFLSLLSSGSPSIIDIVYTPQLTAMSEIGEILVARRRRFIHAEKAKKNFIGYAGGMVTNADKGERPVKSLRSACLTGEVVLAFLEKREYNPLTIENRTCILNSKSEKKLDVLRQALREVLYRIEVAEVKNEFDEDFVRTFNRDAYLTTL